jgi:hypothetical protein
MSNAKKTSTSKSSSTTAARRSEPTSKKQANESNLRQQVLDDLRRVARDNPGITLTRNFYRANATFTEKVWQRFFGTFTGFMEAAELKMQAADPELQETNVIDGNKWEVTLPKTRISTLEELIEHCKVDTSIWFCERFVVNKWEVGAKNLAGKIEVEPLFQVKATMVRKVEVAAFKREVESLIRKMKANAPHPAVSYPRTKKTGYMLEINIPDLHAGKLSWSRETGYQNYDLSAAIATFRRALRHLLARVAHITFDQILLVVGNDLLHSDDLEGRTTSGTYVNVDGRYHKCFEAVRDLKIEVIEQLRRLAPVKVISCPGNHDTKVAWHVADSLSMYFRNYKDVTFDKDPTPRKFHKHGDVMLMFTHGHGGKRKDYPLSMATQERQMWGSSRFCEVHTGHLHQTRNEEFFGVRVRVLSALCPPDAWHSNNNFIGNLLCAEAFVWHETDGLTDIVFYNEAA